MALSLRSKFSVLKGDITKMTTDCIVNAANSSLLGGLCPNETKQWHKGFLSKRRRRCRRGHPSGGGSTIVGGMPNTERVRSRRGENHKSKSSKCLAIIHTVGPQIGTEVSDEQCRQLRDCYANSLSLARDNKLRSIAFPCISTGVYNFPKKEASEIAIKTVRDWLTEGQNNEKLDTVIFCVFGDDDLGFYEKNIPQFIL